MKRLGGLLRRQDAFGEPITINYRGETTFTTMLGAIVSFAEKVFILVVAVMGLIDLFTYKDPNITQYSIYDSRQDNKEYNFKEANGSLLFGIFHEKDEKYVDLDPRYGRMRMGQRTTKWNDDLSYDTDIMDVSVDRLTRENFPNEYEVFMDDISDEMASLLGPVYLTK